MGKKVFSIYMGNPDSSNHAELDLPATPWELIDALDKLRLEDGREPYWQVEDIGRYGFLAPLLDGSDLYQFNALAEQLSTFDHVEAIAFEGLVQMEVDELCQTNGGELTLQRLLDLAYSVDGCHVVAEVRDDAALGRFYVENDFLPELEQMPDGVLELLDYAKIGEKMRRDEHGAMTPNGYVVREAELRQAPPNLGRPPRKPPYMIHFLCVSDVRAVKLYLPAKQAELDAVLDCLEVDSWQEVQLEECDTAMPEMWAFVQHNVCHTGICHESRSAADGAVLRNRQGRLCPLGKGCSGSCCGVHKRTIPGYDRLLSAQCAPDAGFLAVVQRHAGTAWRSASLELDTERCDHGGRAARRGAPLVHPAGYSTESIQGGASANDRGFCVSGKCSRRKGRCVV